MLSVSIRAFRLAERPDLVDEVSELLAGQWPVQGAEVRRSALLAHCRGRAKQLSPLPCHIVMVNSEETTVAHCRLQAACDTADGFSAALTSVVVSPEMRGKGVGRMLLAEAEAAAASAGFAYMYLWTHDAQGFYAKSGYSECEKVLYRRNLQPPSCFVSRRLWL